MGRGGVYFCCFVLGGGDEVGSVRGHLHVCHLHAIFVSFDVFEEFAAFCVVLGYRPIFMSCDDVF